MRILRPAVGLLLCAIALSGCVPGEPTEVPTPEPSSTPVFASEEEALAAAEEAYAAYLAVSDAISQDGGAEPERIEPYVTPEWLEVELEAYRDFSSSGVRQSGSTTFSNATLQSSSDREATIYACTDSSATRFVDSSGQDVTPDDRQVLTSVQVTFRIQDGDLRLEGLAPWGDNSFCS